MPDYDRLIIGAGVIGLAIARRFAKSGESVLLVEANANFGTQTSSRNSEVVHAGIYYPSASIKARLCAKGARDLHAYCQARHIPLAKHGKLIVASDDSSESHTHLHALKALKARGDANGVEGLAIIDSRDLKQREPHLTASAALYSPATSVLDAHSLMAALEADAINYGAVIVYRTQFLRATRSTQGFTAHLATTSTASPAVPTASSDSETTPASDSITASPAVPISVPTASNDSETTRLTARSIINCAGHAARQVSLAIDGIAQTSIPPHYIAKGQYFTTTRPPPFRHLIYPLPDKGGLGIHLTRDTSGGSRFGPDIRWLGKGEVADYSASPKDAPRFWRAIRRYWADLQPDELVPAWAGLRPKTVPDASQFQDFIIHHHTHHQCPGAVALYGIDSPGLTACLAIADYVYALSGD